jgi:hypothetical protein
MRFIGRGRGATGSNWKFTTRPLPIGAAGLAAGRLLPSVEIHFAGVSLGNPSYFGGCVRALVESFNPEPFNQAHQLIRLGRARARFRPFIVPMGYRIDVVLALEVLPPITF